MTSYNRVNGLHVAEDPWLLRDILRNEFGLGDGLIMSDWSGTYSSSDAIKASLDLEMPGPAYVRGVCVERDIVGGKLRPEDVNECVQRASLTSVQTQHSPKLTLSDTQVRPACTRIWHSL